MVTLNDEKELKEETLEKENPKKSFQRKLRKLEEERDKAEADSYGQHLRTGSRTGFPRHRRRGKI